MLPFNTFSACPVFLAGPIIMLQPIEYMYRTYIYIHPGPGRYVPGAECIKLALLKLNCRRRSQWEFHRSFNKLLCTVWVYDNIGRASLVKPVERVSSSMYGNWKLRCCLPDDITGDLLHDIYDREHQERHYSCDTVEEAG